MNDTTEPEYVLSEFDKKHVVVLREQRQRNDFKSGVKFINDVLSGVIPIDQAISSTKKNYEVFEVVGMSARLNIEFDERINFGMLYKAVVEALEELEPRLKNFAGLDRQTDALILKRNVELAKQCKTAQELIQLLNTGTIAMLEAICAYIGIRIYSKQKSAYIEQIVAKLSGA